jgi:hypothetical protein
MSHTWADGGKRLWRRRFQKEGSLLSRLNTIASFVFNSSIDESSQNVRKGRQRAQETKWQKKQKTNYGIGRIAWEATGRKTDLGK